MPHQTLLFRVFVCALLLCGFSTICVGADKESGAGGIMIGKDGAPMVLVPAGEFLYGDNNQRLSLSSFYMDKYELTTSRYAKFLQETGREKPYRWGEASPRWQASQPVMGVNWHDADAYCRWAGKRLPTEQEWEKAARGTDGRKYPWGNEEPTSRHANMRGSTSTEGYFALTDVGSLKAGASPYGIHDMAGNVWEWTSSDYGSSNKVIRGGSWSVTPPNLRSTYRLRNTPAYRQVRLGFRCAQDAR